jgi:hypothetical protein
MEKLEEKRRQMQEKLSGDIDTVTIIQEAKATQFSIYFARINKLTECVEIMNFDPSKPE